MKHDEYVASRIAKDPRFAAERTAAEAELEFATVIAEQRRARKLTIDMLAGDVGISSERLRAIEEGESATLNEVLWLSHALDLVVRVSPELRIETTVRPRVYRLFGQTTPVVTTGMSLVNRPPWLLLETTTSQREIPDSAAAR